MTLQIPDIAGESIPRKTRRINLIRHAPDTLEARKTLLLHPKGVTHTRSSRQNHLCLLAVLNHASQSRVGQFRRHRIAAHDAATIGALRCGRYCHLLRWFVLSALGI